METDLLQLKLIMKEFKIKISESSKDRFVADILHKGTILSQTDNEVHFLTHDSGTLHDHNIQIEQILYLRIWHNAGKQLPIPELNSIESNNISVRILDYKEIHTARYNYFNSRWKLISTKSQDISFKQFLNITYWSYIETL